MSDQQTPKLTKVRRHFTSRVLPDLPASLAKELQSLQPLINPGANIALAVGSRGITDIVPIVRQTVAFLKQRQANPFIVPAMGSHGGATAQGQTEILRDLGITTSSVGAEIRSSMVVVDLPRGRSPIPVFMDRNAWESDGVIIINRIKLHTDYHDRYDSGLAKMSVIGLGKDAQAREVHRLGIPGLKDIMPTVAQQILSTGKILAGIAIVEDAYDRTMVLRVLPSDRIMAEEPGLLETSRQNMPSLPVERIDVLIVDRIGKDISGTCLDPNIIGRLMIKGQPEPTSPNITAIIACDLTDASHGNALGIGMADVITKKLHDKVDFRVMYENVYTSTFFERAKVPVTADNPRKALDFALRLCTPLPLEKLRIMRIPDTLHLEHLHVSQSILDELRDQDNIDILTQPTDAFDPSGELALF